MKIYQSKSSAKYRHGYELMRRRGAPMQLLKDIIAQLENGETLTNFPWRDHPLKGDQKGLRECHVTDDWVLVYLIDRQEKILYLVGTGTHEDLGLQKPRKH